MFDASFVAPQAMLLRRTDRALDRDVLRLCSELIRCKNAVIDRDRHIGQLSVDIAESRKLAVQSEQLNVDVANAREQIQSLEAKLISTEMAPQRAAVEVQGALEHLMSQN